MCFIVNNRSTAFTLAPSILTSNFGCYLSIVTWVKYLSYDTCGAVELSPHKEGDLSRRVATAVCTLFDTHAWLLPRFA